LHISFGETNQIGVEPGFVARNKKKKEKSPVKPALALVNH
jgi:hypothetical protein